MASFSFSAQAAIYNASPNLSAFYLSSHRAIKMRELWPQGYSPDYAVIDENYVRSFVAALPNDRTYMFDLEGSPNETSDNRYLWHYESSPDTAVTLRENFMFIVNDERPDLDIGIWGIPDQNSVRDLIKEPDSLEYSQEIGERVWEYRSIVENTDTIYVSAYWPWRADYSESRLEQEQKMDEWKALVRMKIALSDVFYKRLPVVYLSHRAYGDQPSQIIGHDPWSGKRMFKEMVDFATSQCVNIAFWAPDADTDTTIPSWVKNVLWLAAWEQYFSDPCIARGQNRIDRIE